MQHLLLPVVVVVFFPLFFLEFFLRGLVLGFRESGNRDKPRLSVRGVPGNLATLGGEGI